MGFSGTAQVPQASQALVTEVVQQPGRAINRALDVHQTFFLFYTGMDFLFLSIFSPPIHHAEYL